MWKRLTVVVVVGLALAASSVGALEKTAMRVTDVEQGDWASPTTCALTYYNYCTGWIWVWGGWQPNDVIGVRFHADNCGFPGEQQYLCTTSELIYTAAPLGYGFTGTIDVWTTDANSCLVGRVAGQPFYFQSGWNVHAWGGMVIPRAFVVTVTFGPGPGIPSRMASDHPAVGPTGPQACGYCYALPRTCRSYYYGTATSPYCPGVSLSDDVCCVEWIWESALVNPNSLQPSSWGNIKALYR